MQGMTIGDMFTQSGALALLGMGVVFGFLIILICAITISGRIINALGLNKEPPAAKPASAPVPGAGDNAVIAAISAAVRQYRQN